MSSGGATAGWRPAPAPCRAATSSRHVDAAGAHVVVQLGDGGDLGAQRGDLADHVHALAALRGVVDLDQVVARRASRPLLAMRRRPRLSCSSSAHIALRVDAVALRAGPCARRRRARSRSRRSGWRGPARSRAARCARSRTATSWKRGGDGAAGDGLLGEEVGGAHEHADVGAPGGERRGRGRDHGGGAWRRGCRRRTARARSSGRSTASSRSICASHRAKLDRGPTWPPHSRPSNTKRRAPSFRKRSSRPGRRHVEVGGDARRLEGRGLRRADRRR